MLAIPKRFPLSSRHILGTVVLIAGFVGATSLLRTYVPRDDPQSDVVIIPKNGPKNKNMAPPATTPPAESTPATDTYSNVYVYKPWPIKPQASVVPPAPAESTPAVPAADSPPITEQPHEEPAPPQDPDPEPPVEPTQ